MLADSSAFNTAPSRPDHQSPPSPALRTALDLSVDVRHRSSAALSTPNTQPEVAGNTLADIGASHAHDAYKRRVVPSQFELTETASGSSAVVDQLPSSGPAAPSHDAEERFSQV